MENLNIEQLGIGGVIVAVVLGAVAFLQKLYKPPAPYNDSDLRDRIGAVHDRLNTVEKDVAYVKGEMKARKGSA